MVKGHLTGCGLHGYSLVPVFFNMATQYIYNICVCIYIYVYILYVCIYIRIYVCFFNKTFFLLFQVLLFVCLGLHQV